MDYATPHVASPGTIGARPINLGMNPGFRRELIEAALRASVGVG